MRIRTLFLLTVLLPAAASSQEWCDAPICAQFEGTDQIRIRAPASFEVTFTKREGFGQEVYDLVNDPGKLYDLSASYEENGILWVKLYDVLDVVGYAANNATTLELLEASGARVRARMSGQHHRYGLPGMPWADLGYTQTFTVYATGEVGVDYELIAARDIDLNQFGLVLKSAGQWGPNASGLGAGEAHCVGEYGLALPYQGTATSFAMMSSDGSHYFADVLMALHNNIYNGSYWNEGFQDGDDRCGLFLWDFHPTLPTGTSHLPLMMRIGRDMNDPAGGAKYANSYRNPDTDLDVTQGTQVLDDPGDFDGDGFDETEAAYVLRRQSGDVEFVLHAGIPRMNPAFKILDWNEPAPLNLWIDDVSYAEGTQFHASVTGGTLIVQLLGERNADTEVRVAGAVEVPTLPWLGGVLLAAGLGAIGARRIARTSRAS